jgi:hypothetical protein
VPRTPTFAPVCPACRYDLGGLPDGLCPECGARFTREDLEIAHRIRHARVPLDERARSHAPLVAALFMSWCGPQSGEVRLEILLQAVMWGAAAWWIALRRSILAGPGARQALWLLFPCARTAIGFGQSPAWFVGPILAAPAAAIVLWWAAGRSWSRVGAIAAGLFGLFGIGLGAVLTAWGARWIIAGHHRSPWELPSVLGVDGRYTTARDVLSAGIILLVAAGQALLVAAACRRRARGAAPSA